MYCFQICLLHLNELPLRKIFSLIDGVTKGPNLYQGPIGKSLEDCRSIEIAFFKSINISSEFVTILNNIDDISSDQRYLRDIILAIHNNYVSPSLSNRSPGKLGYARWLTTANRILRHYVATSDPSVDLVKIVTFVINVYARSWFSIKSSPLFTDAPKHIFNMILYINELDDEIITTASHTIIQRNAFCLHSENLLCSMLTDPRPNIRIMAVNRILEVRSVTSGDNRQFIVPKVNFKADDYYQLIDNKYWLESILTIDYQSNYLSTLTIENVPIFKFDAYPCHTQAVERHIRLVSQTALSISNPEERDSRINITLLERKLMPSFRSKQDFIRK